MRLIILLVFGLFLTGAVQAQVGSSISSDGTAPNTNAMLDVKSPATGDGKGMLIPRVTGNQRTTASSSLAGGLLDNSGNLRGGAAQGLIVYQTDGVQGLYFNTSLTAVPAWVYLGAETDPVWSSASNAIVADIATRLVSNVWAADDSTTNYLPRTGGTMSGTLNMGAQIITNVASISFYYAGVSVGYGADGSSYGAALGYNANGSDFGAAVGDAATGSSYGAAMGYLANGSSYGAAVGREANGYNYGAALGILATGTIYGAALGRSANGSTEGVAVGYLANGYWYGAALGSSATGYQYGAAVGRAADGSDVGAALGYLANASGYGAAMGYLARGFSSGAALGRGANGAQTNVAIGAFANALGGTEQIAIGHNVTNNLPNTARIRGNLYLDGGSSIYTNNGVFGSSDWGIKAFTIPHPFDPENKILRHFCLEGPQVWNVYAGNAQLVNGQAVVELPDYYSALNLVGSEIYSLTPIGELAVLAIGEEVDENFFTIIGDKDVKVSWTIKVLRNDPGCLEDLRRRPVEQLKRDLAR